MAKFCGVVGYALSNNVDGIVTESIEERRYYGDVLNNNRRLENNDVINDNIKINNSISILADAYAYEHFYAMRYVTYMNVKWRVTNVEVKRPRLILTLGDVYNGKQD